MNATPSSELSNVVLEFHDSNVASVKAVDGGLQIFFGAAYAHRSNGEPGVEAGSGYIQAVEFLLREVTWTGALEQCIGAISDGELAVDSRPIGLVPLPFRATGSVTLHLQFSNGSVLSVTGSYVQVYQSGPSRFVEKYAC